MPRYVVQDPIDVLHVQSHIGKYAQELGFRYFESKELAIVATELASNILKYGGGRGDLSAQPIEQGEPPGIELLASDVGPPFRNLAAAMNDGWDDEGPIDPLHYLKRKGIGGGLGAITRFTDTFQVIDLEVGKKIVVRRYLSASPRAFR